MRKVETDHSVTGWFLQGVDFADAPSSMSDLAARFNSIRLQAKELARSSKWEPLFRGHVPLQQPGWVPLSTLASTRRGIATGANGFFLLNESSARLHGIRCSMLLPCIGKSLDVTGMIFCAADYEALRANDAKCLLLNLIDDELTVSERAYVAKGEADGLLSRYILANRRPWYSMEQRKPAPIWAAVFGRGDLGFIYNEVGARSLTNFHCVYPRNEGREFTRALTTVLNARSVRSGARAHIRGYGGGLMKVEPNDLKSIQVPDLESASDETVHKLSDLLEEIDVFKRCVVLNENTEDRIDALVAIAAQEAERSQRTLF